MSIFPGFLGHPFGREPSDGISFYIMVLESSFKVGNKHGEGFHGDGGANKGFLTEGGCPSEGGSFGHVGEGEDDFLHIRVVYFLIYCEVE